MDRMLVAALFAGITVLSCGRQEGVASVLLDDHLDLVGREHTLPLGKGPEMLHGTPTDSETPESSDSDPERPYINIYEDANFCYAPVRFTGMVGNGPVYAADPCSYQGLNTFGTVMASYNYRLMSPQLMDALAVTDPTAKYKIEAVVEYSVNPVAYTGTFNAGWQNGGYGTLGTGDGAKKNASNHTYQNAPTDTWIEDKYAMEIYDVSLANAKGLFLFFDIRGKSIHIKTVHWGLYKIN